MILFEKHSKDIGIIGTEMEFPSYHKASRTSYSTSTNVLVPSRMKNKHENLKFALEPTWQDVPYLSSFITKSWLNDLKDIAQGQWSVYVCATQPLIEVIICAQYGKNPSRTVHAVEQTQQDVPYFSSFIAKSWLNYLEDVKLKGHYAWHTLWISC